MPTAASGQRILLFLSLCLVHGLPRGAAAADPVAQGRPPISTTLVADISTLTPGESFHVGVWFTLDPGWHLYWQNPGDAGYATELLWQLGDATVEPLQWPAPEIFREADGVTTYGYQGEVLLFARATASDSVSTSLDVAVQVNYLACNVICSPHQVTLRRHFPVEHDTLPADEATQKLFAEAAKRVPLEGDAAPLPVRALFSQSAVRPGDDFRMAILLQGCQAPDTSCAPLTASEQPFVPLPTPGLHLTALHTRPNPDDPAGLVIVLAGHLAAPSDPKKPANVSGVLQLNRSGVPLRPFRVDMPVPRADVYDNVTVIHDARLDEPANLRSTDLGATAPMAAPSFEFWVVLRATALALLGGLVLNLMPCVLPVLAIKVIGITQIKTQNRRAIVWHGAAYTFGVVTSMMLLAAAVLGLRAIGTQVGWGFQFQEPWFVAVLSCILVLFALNCFGVFEVYASADALGRVAEKAHGWQRSAFDGVLAVVLATPCSAPFLGSAVAFALTQGSLVNVLIFAAIGFGLATPYVVLTWIPGWLRFMPKPGPWMNHLKALLGFGLLATVVWLVWLIGRFAGIDAVARLLLFLLGVALIGWIYGRINARFLQHQMKMLLAAILGITGLGFYTLSFSGEPPMPNAPEALMYRPYNHAAVLAELAAGRAVFVDFDADWCITCKYNEQHVLNDLAVVNDLRQANVALFRADYTRRDDNIRHTLASFGRSGVPMYLLYSPHNPTGPNVLPELLTVSLMRHALQNIAR